MTSKELARLAGVSRGTVDRALHGRDGVNPDVAARIRDLAQAHGYTPDPVGRALVARGKQARVGVLLPSIGNPFFLPLLEGLRTAAGERAHCKLELVLIEQRGYDVTAQCQAIAQLKDSGVRALLLTPIHAPEVIRAVDALEIPVVCVNSDLPSTRRVAYVGCDYAKSGAVAAELMALCAGGACRVGVITGSREVLGHRQRVDGFLDACGQEHPAIKPVEIVAGDDDDERTAHLVRQLIKRHAPDALYFAAGGVTGGLGALTGKAPAPTIIACDETPATRGALFGGVVKAIVTQQPFQQGYRALQIAFEAAFEGKLPAEPLVYTQNEIKLRSSLTP